MFGNRIDIRYGDTSDGRSFFNFILYIARNGTVTTADQNAFIITYRVGFDEYILRFTGSNFLYGPNGPVAGNLYGLDIINFSRPLYDSFGYDTSIATMWTAIKDSLLLGSEVPLSNHFDTFEHYVTGTGLGDLINGGALSDNISGLNGNDVINGRDGNDVIGGGNGEDTINGGFGDDIINGDAGNDIIFGDAGNDILRGNAGTDELRGGIGNDSLEGGDQNDVLYGDAGTDTLNGGTGDDIVYGGDDADIVGGGADVDILYGQSGNDRLFGDAGNDNLYGGAGADVLNGGTELDLARYDNATTGIYVRLDGVAGASGEAVGDTFVSIEGLVGSYFSDYLIGSANSDYLFGLGGDDWLYGLSGNDYLFGGTGSDRFYGGQGDDYFDGGDASIDYAVYDNTDGNLTLRLDYSSLNTGAAAGDIYVSIEGLIGGLGSDVIIGDAATNVLIGGGGSDYIDGQTGNDYLLGGADADTFGFTAVLGMGNVDIIGDFTHLTDRILLSQSVFASIGLTLETGELAFGTAALDANDYLFYNQGTGQIFYDSDGNGTTAAILFATVTAGTALTIDDFTVA
jgi:Ca2+-binding RTX toxin-like protein